MQDFWWSQDYLVKVCCVQLSWYNLTLSIITVVWISRKWQFISSSLLFSWSFSEASFCPGGSLSTVLNVCSRAFGTMSIAIQWRITLLDIMALRTLAGLVHGSFVMPLVNWAHPCQKRKRNITLLRYMAMGGPQGSRMSISWYTCTFHTHSDVI